MAHGAEPFRAVSIQYAVQPDDTEMGTCAARGREAEQMRRGNPGIFARKQLCWDCAKATNGGCSWSRRFEPVKGWTAEPNTREAFSTYEIIACPEFERDAAGNGQYRLKTGEGRR